MCFSPKPSMSKALRDTKCLSRSTLWAGQIRPPVQRLTTSSLPVVGIHLAHGMAAAGGAHGGKAESFRALGPLAFNHAENLRDDVAGTLDDHRVADAHVLARDLVLIVQRGVLHHDAADGHRLELGDRRERAGAAHLDLDVAQDRGRLLGREFVGDGIAGRARDEAEPLLPGRAGRAYRRRRRCRSRGRRARSRCRDRCRASPRPSLVSLRQRVRAESPQSAIAR